MRDAPHATIHLDTAGLDRAVHALQQQKLVWARLPVRAKADLMLQVRQLLGVWADEWVRRSVEAKGIAPDSTWVGEEWISGPWAFATGINGYLETLEALARGRLPRLRRVRTRPNGQVAAEVFPRTLFDRLLLNGTTAEVWMQPGLRAEELGASMATFYRQRAPEGAVALILGAGNINSIPPLDVLYRMLVCGHVALLKMNPVNAYLTPVLEAIFAPLIRLGFLRVVAGGADVGAYLTHHPQVDQIHLTGSAQTHDTIVYGPGPEGAARRARDERLLTKPVTSELGGVGPLIVLPGPWTAADIRYQAENAVTMKLHNGGFNCVAAQVLIMPQEWDLHDTYLDAVRQVLRELPPRHAYYPGAAERQRQAVAAHPGAELFGGAVPRTLIAGISPDEEAYSFSTEFFGAVFAQTSLPGADARSYLAQAVRFCNERLQGTLGASIIVHPATLRELGPAFEEALAALRYGAIGVNVWNAAAFLMAQATWGAYPGHTEDDIQSGIGVVRNALMFDRPEKTVARSSFYPFPRSWRHGDPAFAPRPPWFVTNKMAHLTGRLITRLAADPHVRHLPGIFASALRG